MDPYHEPIAAPEPKTLPANIEADVRNTTLRDVDAVVHRAQRGELIYGILGLVLGFACIICGSILGLRGVTGATSWTAELLGLNSKISDAPPGVVLFIVGVFLVWITKPRTTLRDVHSHK